MSFMFTVRLLNTLYSQMQSFSHDKSVSFSAIRFRQYDSYPAGLCRPSSFCRSEP